MPPAACSTRRKAQFRWSRSPNYRQVIEKREAPASRSQDREDEIILIDWLSPAAATVKVRLRIHANVFVDHLCFVRGVEGWRIVAKVWHLESIRALS
ncbi:nuclear transport factor 2 family protein [Agrobacterium pusense]|uniref:nuclear transport factor 2 family protein n=1 Tax=Agrobacterium pusense TaxID=648995 RepID=UPI003CC7A767